MSLSIELRGVTKSYGAVRALLAVNALFRGGEITAVLGPNGSGKSSLLSIAAGLAAPTSGEVIRVGLGETPAEHRRNVGWLGHEAHAYGDLSGRENLELAGKLYGLGIEAVESSVERFQLAAFAARPLRTYSRGQRQRLALAKALLHRPKLLLLDEPTTGLDESAVGELAQTIEIERQNGAAVVLVTHEAAFAERVRAKTLRLERGRVVA